MPARWTLLQETQKRIELVELYVDENLSIGQIGKKLGLNYTSVYDRLVRLKVPVQRSKKLGYNNVRQDILIPKESVDLAEFVGIMLGDGHLSPTQVTVTLGNKEGMYVEYVTQLINKLFGVRPKWLFSQEGYCTVYLGSTKLVRWFLRMGLVSNKVRSQVDIPRWVFKDEQYLRASIRGLFDTDGSIYRLKNGSIQINLRNFSLKLLNSAREILIQLGFHPSEMTVGSIYLTRKQDICKFITEIGFNNPKHMVRYGEFRK
ncbi:MAG: LAGLIDADG family homing endonuclease [Patescibacteria group bacterium]